MQKEIKWYHSVAYGSGNMLGSGALAISAAWLMYFYTTFCGLTVLEAATIFSVGTIIDGLSNPVMGYVSDNFNRTRLGKKYGRRRFFILLGIPMMLVYPLLWISAMNFWYYLVLYVLFELIYTTVMVSYEALATEMTDDFTLRSTLTGYKAVFGKIANFAAVFIPGRLIATLGKDSSDTFLITACIYTAILVISLFSLYKLSWERSVDELPPEGASLTLAENMKKMFVDVLSTFRIKTFRHHVGMYIFGFGAEWLFASTMTYYIVFSLMQSTEVFSNISSFSSTMQLLATTLFIGYCSRNGFSVPYRMALTICIMSMLGYGALYFTHSADVVIWLSVITAFMGFGTGGVYYIPWNIYTFMADVDEAVTGKRREGIYAGVMTLMGKLVRSSIVYSIGVILKYSGFISGAKVQSEAVKDTIVLLSVAGFIVLALLAIGVTYLFKLTKENHKILLNEISRLKKGGLCCDATPESKKVIEQLTGWKYEECWGNNNVGYKKDGDHNEFEHVFAAVKVKAEVS